MNFKDTYKEEKLIDMHMHSCYSDGELTPDELIHLAVKRNIGTMAITDHNTLNGIKKVDRNKPIVLDSGINIINGIELSAKVERGTMHILGYNMHIEDTNLNNKLNDFRINNLNYFMNMISQVINDHKLYFEYEDILALIDSNRNIGRPDIAKLCMKYGYSTNVQDAFDKYLISSYEKIRHLNKLFFKEECIDMILNSGGIPVLAHPKTLKLSRWELIKVIEELTSYGLKGIEVYHSSHSKEETILYLEIAKKYNLLISGGSDYHGINIKPDIEIGTGKNNNLKIKKLSLVDYIKR